MSNGLLSYFMGSQYKTISIDVMGINYGNSIQHSEVQGRKNRTVYFQYVIYDNFILHTQSKNHDEYEKLAKWLDDYVNYAFDPNSGARNPMYVDVEITDPKAYSGGTMQPFRSCGILDQGISFGDEVGQITYDMQLVFVGTLDLLAPTASTFAKIDDLSTGPTQTSFFYPSGQQSSTPAQPVEEVLFNTAPPFSTLPSSSPSLPSIEQGPNQSAPGVTP